MDGKQEAPLLGHVAWDGTTATSERVLLRAGVRNRGLVERNQYVRIQDEDGVRSGFLARVVAGPFFHRSGTPTVAGMTAGASMECFLLADLEVQGELVGGRAEPFGGVSMDLGSLWLPARGGGTGGMPPVARSPRR